MSGYDRPTGASLEALKAHLDNHPCGCDMLDRTECPCGTTRAVVCAQCGDPVLVSYDPSKPLCTHAEALLARSRVRPLPRHYGRRRRRRRRP